MTTLRYVKTLEQVKKAQEANPEFLSSSMRQIRIEYETDPAVYRALVMRPFEPLERPVIGVTFTDISMHLSPENTMTIGAAVFGPLVSYDGKLCWGFNADFERVPDLDVFVECVQTAFEEIAEAAGILGEEE